MHSIASRNIWDVAPAVNNRDNGEHLVEAKGVLEGTWMAIEENNSSQGGSRCGLKRNKMRLQI